MWGQTQLRPSLALGNSPQGCKGPTEPTGVGGLNPVLGAAPVVPLGWRELCRTSSERSPIGIGMAQSGSWCHHCCSVWLACRPAPSIVLTPNLLCPQQLLGPPRVVVLWRRRKEKGRKAQTQLQRLPEAAVLSRLTHLKLLPTSTPRSSCGAALPSRVVPGDPACWEHTTALGAVQCHATSGHLMAQQMRMPLRGLLSPQGVRGQNRGSSPEDPPPAQLWLRREQQQHRRPAPKPHSHSRSSGQSSREAGGSWWPWRWAMVTNTLATWHKEVAELVCEGQLMVPRTAGDPMSEAPCSPCSQSRSRGSCRCQSSPWGRGW